MTNLNSQPSVPAVAMRRSLNGIFVDFDLLPDLLRLMEGLDTRQQVENAWVSYLGEAGCNSDYVENDHSGVADLTQIASGAWRLAETCGLMSSVGLTSTGLRVASGRNNVVEALAQGIRESLIGQGGTKIVPLLQRSAGELCATDHMWAKFCPGLLPIEMGAIVHWACVNEQRCRSLMTDLVTWRDVAMHSRGEPDPRLGDEANMATHYEAVVGFYLSQPRLAERTPMHFSEEVAMVKLLDFAGLLKEMRLGEMISCLVPAG